MKTIRPISLILIALFLSITGIAQEKVPELKSGVPIIEVYKDKKRFMRWKLVPEANPDVLDVNSSDKAHEIMFVTDVDKISFTVEKGKTYDFIIRFGDKICKTRIVGGDVDTVPGPGIN